MKKTFLYAFIGASLFSISSCTDVETDTKSTQAFYNCYAIVTDNETGDVSVSQPISIGLSLNWTQSTAEATLSGMSINGNVLSQIVLNKMKWDATSDGLWGSVTNTPSASYVTNQQVEISDFEFKWSDRLDMPTMETSESYDPALVYRFTMDGRYSVEGSRTPFSFWGTTTATAVDGSDEPFTGSVNNIIALPDFKNMTMTVLVSGAQFAPKMPALDIQLDNIPMQFVDGGKSFTFEADNLIPSIAGTPYPNYPCSNITGTLNPEEGMTFSFDCNVMGRIVYNVSTSPTVFGYR